MKKSTLTTINVQMPDKDSITAFAILRPGEMSIVMVCARYPFRCCVMMMKMRAIALMTMVSPNSTNPK